MGSSRSYPGKPVRRAVVVLAAPCVVICRGVIMARIVGKSTVIASEN
jgi:hypothetical protein